MKLTKSARLDAARPDIESELALINTLAKTELTADEVYVFPVRLCDNDVDRDHERFTEEALGELSGLFEGLTGIFDHDWSAARQKARIFRTELVTEPERKNALGQPYVYLRAWAYMLKTESTAELIAEIEGGIKREVSIGCSMGESRCSICGEETGSGRCQHVRGREYAGKLCFAELSRAVDAYEWSFVAVPAQRGAGVLKRFGAGEDREGHEELLKLAELGRRYLGELRGEVRRLGLLADPELGEALCSAVECMGEDELRAFKKSFELQVNGRFPPETQLPGVNRATRFDDGAEYQI